MFLLICGILITNMRVRTLQAAEKSKKQITTIIDTEGKIYKAKDLSAKYTAGGMWIGSRPETRLEDLNIVLYIVDERVTTEERMMVPFSSMRFLVFRGASVPEKLKEAFKEQEPILIERRDGSVIVLSDTLLIEMDSKGNEKKRLKIDRYSFNAGEHSGQSITLDGFIGRAKTKAGKEGDFYIYYSDTKSIEF